jgi:hypothetical protein
MPAMTEVKVRYTFPAKKGTYLFPYVLHFMFLPFILTAVTLCYAGQQRKVNQLNVHYKLTQRITPWRNSEALAM